jgi:hypothetical protein
VSEKAKIKSGGLVVALDPLKTERGERLNPLRRPRKAADFDFAVDGVEVKKRENRS